MKGWLLICLLLAHGLAGAEVLPAERQRLLEGGQPQPTGLALDAPEWIEDGAFVPLTVRLEGAQPPVRLVLLRLAEDEPRIARIQVEVRHEPLELSTRVRLPQSQTVEVIARDANGRTWRASTKVRVAGSSCLAPAPARSADQPGSTRAWLREQGDSVELVSLLRHPMETGRRTSLDGQLLPRRLLQGLSLESAGEPWLLVEPFEGLAANPYWRLLLPAGAAKLEMRWLDADGSEYRHRL